MTRAEARRTIEERFRKTVDKDVSFLVAEQLEVEGKTEAAGRCAELDADLSQHLWQRFGFSWSAVAPNPGGTLGHASAFLQQKAALLYDLAVDDGKTDMVSAASDLVEDLRPLWLEWAGYMVTSAPGLECALD